MWGPARGLVACVLSLGLGVVSINPNTLKKDGGDKIKVEAGIQIWKGKNLSFMLTLMVLELFAGIRFWKDEGFAMYTKWSIFDASMGLACLGAILLRATAMLMLGRLFSFQLGIRKEHRLITTGPYRWIRHPSYAGVYLQFLTYGFLVRWPLYLVLTLFSATALKRDRIFKEEKMLHGHFGKEWEQYAAKTKKLIPFVY